MSEKDFNLILIDQDLQKLQEMQQEIYDNIAHNSNKTVPDIVKIALTRFDSESVL